MFFSSPPLNKIGFYQFDNLINNRVPFLFINLSSNDLSDWYESIYKIHVKNQQILIQENQIEEILSERQIPLEFAILLLCRDGKQSEKLAKNLTKKGYTNVYLIDGGYQQMVTDRS